MPSQTITIPQHKHYAKEFSICTLVNNPGEYELMKESFIKNGFTEHCEFLIADNISRNNFNPYQALRRFMQEATGRYLVVVHQDVRCIDSCEKLLAKLQALQTQDNSWAVCGNAGGNGYKDFSFSIKNKGKIKKSDKLPARVTSLDENFLIIRSDCGLAISADIEFFHFYGTDLCLLADILGFTCYVIDFMVNHLSAGNLADMEMHKPAFVAKYGRKLRNRFIQTSCTTFYLGRSTESNKRYNSGPAFFWVKALQRMSNLFGKK
ncbi:MAG: hypothetical protein ABIO05_01635 [Ferruginibacter sp.]